MIMAPTKVSGRFRSRPSMAAAKLLSTSRVRLTTSSEKVEAVRIPASPPRAAPIIHDRALSAWGLPPLSPMSSRSSTTPRMAVPTRVLKKSRRRPAAVTTASAIDSSSS